MSVDMELPCNAWMARIKKPLVIGIGVVSFTFFCAVVISNMKEDPTLPAYKDVKSICVNLEPWDPDSPFVELPDIRFYNHLLNKFGYDLYESRRSPKEPPFMVMQIYSKDGDAVELSWVGPVVKMNGVFYNSRVASVYGKYLKGELETLLATGSYSWDKENLKRYGY